MRSKLWFSLAICFTTPASFLAGHPPVDPCTKIARKDFVSPTDALACLRSFPFNETLRDNVMTVMDRIFDFYTFENYYLDSPAPFQGSTVNIRNKLAKMRATKYKTDHDFNREIFDFTTALNDGHMRFISNCYHVFSSVLPTPIISIEVDGVQGIFVAPDAPEIVKGFGKNFDSYYENIKFDWKQLAGARVIAIEGHDPWEYVDFIAKSVPSGALDDAIRVNSVFTGYRISGTEYSQRLGSMASRIGVAETHLGITLVRTGTNKAETVDVPFVARFSGKTFEDMDSYWANNCEETKEASFRKRATPFQKRSGPGSIFVDDKLGGVALALPAKFRPTAKTVNSNKSVIKSYILPDNKTGVMFVGTFVSVDSDYDVFQADVASAIKAFQRSGVKQLLIDLSANPGGFVELGFYLVQYLSGSKAGYIGFESTMRANPLSQKLVATVTALGLNQSTSFYAADQWAFINGTQMPTTYNYMDPPEPLMVNGRSDPTSQRFRDIYEIPAQFPKNPPFDLNKVAIVSSGLCGSTCALFSTSMFERYNTTIAVFGGKPGKKMEFKGSAGNQLSDYNTLMEELRLVNLTNDPLAPPELLISANITFNFRTAWSTLEKAKPIGGVFSCNRDTESSNVAYTAYLSERSQLRFPYTKETYINPQALWTFAAQKLFP